MTSERYPTSTAQEREAAIEAAALTVQRGDLVVLPTDTVYGLAADAFDVDAVADLLAAKGRGRDMPPPVLISTASTLEALAIDLPAWVRTLTAAFWPGPLTVVCRQQTSLQWDLGDTRGTVAVRMPDHELIREILDRTGPLAVSSANTTGQPAATSADQAEQMLGEKVTVIVDDGDSPGGESSTIIDATSGEARVLRRGALGLDRIAAVLAGVGETLTDDHGDVVPVPVSLTKPAADHGTDHGPGDAPDDGIDDGTEQDAGAVAAAKAAARSAAAKKAAATRAANRAAAGGTAPAKKAPAKRSTTRKAPAKKAAAQEAPATKAAAVGTGSTGDEPITGLDERAADGPAGAAG